MSERRRFSRVLFSSHATLHGEEINYPVTLLDLSLKGALITKPEQWLLPTSPLTLQITLGEDNSQICMQVTVKHEEDSHLGLQCDHIDIDSISHLRRLIELNMGDGQLLQRELEQLVKTNYDAAMIK